MLVPGTSYTAPATPAGPATFSTPSDSSNAAFLEEKAAPPAPAWERDLCHRQAKKPPATSRTAPSTPPTMPPMSAPLLLVLEESTEFRTTTVPLTRVRPRAASSAARVPLADAAEMEADAALGSSVKICGGCRLMQASGPPRRHGLEHAGDGQSGARCLGRCRLHMRRADPAAGMPPALRARTCNRNPTPTRTLHPPLTVDRR